MASLIEVRDMLALQGRMEAAQLSVQLHTPLQGQHIAYFNQRRHDNSLVTITCRTLAAG